jgi:hypothetical protein
MQFPITGLANPLSDSEIAELFGDYHRRILESRDLQHKTGRHLYQEVYDRIGGLAGLSRAAGLKGIVFLFDEMECVATLLTNVRSRLLAYEILNQFVDSRRFPHCVFLFATTLDFRDKLENELHAYESYDEVYPGAYRFAKKWLASDLRILGVSTVSMSENLSYLKRLRAAHEIGYTWPSSEKITDDFIDSFIETAKNYSLTEREIIKSFVEILEITQQNPDCAPVLQAEL